MLIKKNSEMLSLLKKLNISFTIWPADNYKDVFEITAGGRAIVFSEKDKLLLETLQFKAEKITVPDSNEEIYYLYRRMIKVGMSPDKHIYGEADVRYEFDIYD